jgi:hypothetical protein
MGKAILLLPLLALVIGLAVPAAAASTAPSGTSSASLATTHTMAPVFVHFTAKHLSGVPGGTVSGTVTVKNNGGYAFDATSCILWFRAGTSGSWTKSGGCLSPSAFPVTFNAHSKTKFSGTQHVSATFPTGTCEWKFALVGGYNGVTDRSHSGTVSVTIT